MKKGYQCPRCGNNNADKVGTIAGRGASISVLLTPQRLLSAPDSEIACTVCGCQPEGDIFSTRKIYQYADITADRSGLS